MKKVLLVEDDLAFLHVMAHTLCVEGYDVRMANDGNEAMALVRTGKFDLIITDMIMPGKEGIELILGLRASAPGVKIIAMSGGGASGSGDYLPLAKTLGAHAILRKPFDRENLMRTLNDLFENTKLQVAI